MNARKWENVKTEIYGKVYNIVKQRMAKDGGFDLIVLTPSGKNASQEGNHRGLQSRQFAGYEIQKNSRICERGSIRCGKGWGCP